VGVEKGFDTAEFVAECRHMNVTLDVARNTVRRGGTAIDPFLSALPPRSLFQSV